MKAAGRVLLFKSTLCLYRGMQLSFAESMGARRVFPERHQPRS